MEQLIDFLLFRDPNVRWVVLGVSMMCASSAIVGTFTFLRKRALIGDAISHAILPGICLAFLLTQQKASWILLIGAFISGWLGLQSIDTITRRTKLKADAALGIVLSTFYGFGIVLLTMIQNTGNAAQSGLDKFLFGKAAALVQEDVITFSVFSILLILIVGLFFSAFRMIIFDRDHAQTLGLPIRKLELLLSTLTVFAVAIGIQAVGVVLMAALLITPAAAARYWTHNLYLMLILATAFAVFSGILGTFVSYTFPHMPTGPWIVAVLSVVALLSIAFGRQKGVWMAMRLQRRNRTKMLLENILKCMYHLGEKQGDFNQVYSFKALQAHRFIEDQQLKKGVRMLVHKGWIESLKEGIRFKEEGLREGKRIVRIHRLWELYLTQHMNLPPDHVHEDAEAIEHIITPELERELERQLQHPTIDPHNSVIPR